MDKIGYRSLRRYKYQLMEPYEQAIDILGHTIDTSHLDLTEDGLLTIAKCYAWDGPSGPTFDTSNFMRGSLVHDALYQLIRMRKLDVSYRKEIDLLLWRMAREDGMWWIRAWWVYWGVRLFGRKSARPGTEGPIKIIWAP